MDYYEEYFWLLSSYNTVLVVLMMPQQAGQALAGLTCIIIQALGAGMID